MTNSAVGDMPRCSHSEQSLVKPEWVWVCDACGETIPDSMRDWTEVADVRGDIPEHFSHSAGCVIGSRADRKEYMKRSGTRVCETIDPEKQLAEHEQRRSDKVRHPEKYGGQSLQDFMYETFRGAGGDKKHVRQAIEESKKGTDPEMAKRWEDGRVR